jgi:hypothetical protein
MYQPSTLAELQAVVKANPQLRASGGKGSGRSHEVVMTSLNRILGHTADTIECEAGISLTALIPALTAREQMLPLIFAPENTTLGALVLTGSYGNGDLPLASRVRVLTFVRPDGELERLTPNDPRFATAVLSAGQWYLLYAVTLKTEPLVPLYQYRSYAVAPEQPIQWLTTGLQRQLFYNPYNRKALLYDHRLDYGDNRDHRSLMAYLLHNPTGEHLATELYEEAPRLVPAFIDTVYKLLRGRTSQPHLAPHHQLPLFCFEFAVPVVRAEAVLSQLTTLLNEWRRQRRYALWFGVLLRLVRRYDLSKELVRTIQTQIPARFHVGKTTGVDWERHPGWTEWLQRQRLLQ